MEVRPVVHARAPPRFSLLTAPRAIFRQCFLNAQIAKFHPVGDVLVNQRCSGTLQVLSENRTPRSSSQRAAVASVAAVHCSVLPDPSPGTRMLARERSDAFIGALRRRSCRAPRTDPSTSLRMAPRSKERRAHTPRLQKHRLSIYPAEPYDAVPNPPSRVWPARWVAVGAWRVKRRLSGNGSTFLRRLLGASRRCFRSYHISVRLPTKHRLSICVAGDQAASSVGLLRGHSNFVGCDGSQSPSDRSCRLSVG